MDDKRLIVANRMVQGIAKVSHRTATPQLIKCSTFQLWVIRPLRNCWLWELIGHQLINPGPYILCTCGTWTPSSFTWTPSYSSCRPYGINACCHCHLSSLWQCPNTSNHWQCCHASQAWQLLCSCTRLPVVQGGLLLHATGSAVPANHSMPNDGAAHRRLVRIRRHRQAVRRAFW